MNMQSIIREHVLRQVKKSKSHRIDYQTQAVSFHTLKPHEKRELVAHELLGSDGDDMIVNHDGPQITQLLYSYFVKKNIGADQVLILLMDAIVKRNAINFDEKFSEDFEKYLSEIQDELSYYPSQINRNFEGDYDSPANYA